MKRVFLELGGKSAQIVLDDADLVKRAGRGREVCMHAGQGCAITTRMLLPRSRYAEGVEAAEGGVQKPAVRRPDRTRATCMGPLDQREAARARARLHREGQGRRRALRGRRRPAGASSPKGWYVEPTLFADVDPNATIAQEEIFGPVLSVIPYEDDDDAVRIANNSIYGLSGAVHAGSTERAHVASRSGSAPARSRVNGGKWFGPDSPFGGYKESGIGREHGVAGFEEYLETKTIGYPA